jgi:hypothetical protein
MSCLTYIPSICASIYNTRSYNDTKELKHGL